MIKKYKPVLLVVFLAGLAAAAFWYSSRHSVPVLEPRGLVAQRERGLLFLGLALACVVVLPVFGLTIYFAWRYRETNTKAKYSPDWDHNKFTEFTWWAIPCVIIGILSVAAWNSSHSLDPYRQLDAAGTPLKIQVVALDWKWLFIYPGQNIAAVNFFEMPVGRPVAFEITSDSVMNSFWLPQLGGQIYAMPGMTTQLHLIADSPGSYKGSSANISGQGFSDMTFTAKAVSSADFDGWIRSVQKSTGGLSQASYDRLAQPSRHQPVAIYSSVEPSLYEQIVDKYLTPKITYPNSSSPFLTNGYGPLAGASL